MPIKKTFKIDSSMSMASMSDMVFLLLIFFMITSTMVFPNALKLTLPQSNSQTSLKPVTSVSITKDLRYYVETQPVAIEDLEYVLQQKMVNSSDPIISLHVDETIPIKYAVRVMNIATRNRYRMIMPTNPEPRTTRR